MPLSKEWKLREFTARRKGLRGSGISFTLPIDITDLCSFFSFKYHKLIWQCQPMPPNNVDFQFAAPKSLGIWFHKCMRDRNSVTAFSCQDAFFFTCHVGIPAVSTWSWTMARNSITNSLWPNIAMDHDPFVDDVPFDLPVQHGNIWCRDGYFC
jgi:hypothetical protein